MDLIRKRNTRTGGGGIMGHFYGINEVGGGNTKGASGSGSNKSRTGGGGGIAKGYLRLKHGIPGTI